MQCEKSPGVKRDFGKGLNLWARAVSVARNVPFAGAFAAVKQQSESKISAANAGENIQNRMHSAIVA